MGFFRSFADRLGLTGATSHKQAGAGIVREVAEGATVGAALGVAHAMLPTGLDAGGKMPIDAGLALAGIIGGTLGAKTAFGADLRNVGASAATIFSFRKFYAFAAAKKMSNLALPPEQRIPGDRVQEQNVLLQKQQKGALHAGDFGAEGSDVGAEDEIVAMARSL